jgi:hypothetical protein
MGSVDGAAPARGGGEQMNAMDRQEDERDLGEIWLMAVFAIFVCLLLGAGSAFLATHDRLPDGAGEIMNWIFGWGR